ncbi:hypothetical protein [Helicobacter suis]|uniref:putative barnase/colicin E5 family endoribonuclease n=1 Tax=Helicobacter suis TaxID=104628 RepID=UPI001F079F17|nr:hypothetical protein [Helicobacter suis]
MECISVLCGFFTRYFFISLAFVFFSEKAPNILAETFKAKTFPNQLRQKATKVPLKNQEIPHNPAFGQNFKEFYHNPKGAIAKLIETKEGQVAGAFYRKDLGDIDLVWGEAGSGRSDGYGLAKIAKYHPEVLDKLDDLIQILPIVKESPNRYQLENANYKASMKRL